MIHRRFAFVCSILIFILPVHTNGDRIHEAVKAGRFEEVRSLLEINPQLARIPDENGMTPLHWASVSGRKDIAELLIEKGADLNIKDKWNLTPLSRANQLGRRGVVNLLLERGVELPSDLRDIQKHAHYAAVKGHIKLFEQLMQRSEEANLKNPEGGSFLHSAAEGGAKDIAEMLLKEEIPVDQKDRYGWTALHVAALYGHHNIVEMLAGQGANLNVRTIEGKTAFNYAVDGSNEDVVALLKSKHVDQSPPQFPDLRGEYLGEKRPGEKPQIFALGIVSTRERCHSSLTISPDGKEIYWSPGWQKMLCLVQENGHWMLPCIPSFYSDFGDTEPVFSRDGQRLYFLSQRPLKEGGEKDKENIWYVERIENGWSEAKPFSPVVNSKELHWQISFAENNTIYFGSGEAGGQGGTDIYLSKFKDGNYTKPVNLGKAVNTGFDEFSPYVSPDENYLLFTRQGPGGSRETDLFISFKKGDGSWTDAVSLGREINSEDGDYCPMVSPDGKFLFFVSIRNGNQDIYWVSADIIEKLKTSLHRKADTPLSGPHRKAA
jgi:ankyrin repeat protein